MNRTLPILLAATMALFLIGCGSSGGGDAPPASGGGGSTPGTGSTNDNSTRHYRITSTWSPDTPTGIALNDGTTHPLKLAAVDRVAPRTVNSTIVWGETTSTTQTTIGTATAHLVTALPDVTYVDDLYVTTKTSGTATLELEPILHQGYRLNFTVPVTTSNADGVTSIKFQSQWLSPVASGKHYVDTTLWTVFLTKAASTPTYSATIVPNNPLIMDATFTDGATTGLVLTLNRAKTLGSVVILNHTTNAILSTSGSTTLVAGTPPAQTVTLTLPFARAAGTTYRLVYADPDLSDDIVTVVKGTAGVTRTSWP